MKKIEKGFIKNDSNTNKSQYLTLLETWSSEDKEVYSRYENKSTYRSHPHNYKSHKSVLDFNPVSTNDSEVLHSKNLSRVRNPL